MTVRERRRTKVEGRRWESQWEGRRSKVEGRRWELVLGAEYPGRLWSFRGLRIHGGLQGLGIRLSLGNLRMHLKIRRVAKEEGR